MANHTDKASPAIGINNDAIAVFILRVYLLGHLQANRLWAKATIIYSCSMQFEAYTCNFNNQEQ